MADTETSSDEIIRLGIADVAPSLLGVIPFGLITGVAGVSAGLSFFQTMASSLLLFAGASQLAGYQLIGLDAPVLLVVLTIAVVNLRYVMYSASIAQYWLDWKPWRKIVGAYILVDQTYALSLIRFREARLLQPLPRWTYYISGSIATWLVWQVSVFLGAWLGAKVPPSWSLDFAIPLSFMAMVFGAIKDRPTATAALVGGVAAMLSATMPLNLGLIVASLCGIVAGMLVERRTA